jgi:hypothetical protein
MAPRRGDKEGLRRTDGSIIQEGYWVKIWGLIILYYIVKEHISTG